MCTFAFCPCAPQGLETEIQSVLEVDHVPRGSKGLHLMRVMHPLNEPACYIVECEFPGGQGFVRLPVTNSGQETGMVQLAGFCQSGCYRVHPGGVCLKKPLGVSLA